MFELVKAGGWLMLPIIICSVVALAICIERLIALRRERILPDGLLGYIWALHKEKQLTSEHLSQTRNGSAFGTLIVAGFNNAQQGRDQMKEAIEMAASGVVHNMERYLNTLGTIAAIAPLLGLLGTVIGMIKVFTEIMVQGTGNANVLSGGISEALLTTAAGLSVAIPAVVMHRYFQRRISELVVEMEQEAVKLVDIMHGKREVDLQ